MQEVPVVRKYTNGKGQWIYDLGQNFSGIISVELDNALAGEDIVFRPGELLNLDYSVNQSASGGPFYFKYTTKGGEPEKWQPQFTYYGFRYVQVEGAIPEGEYNPENLSVIIILKGLHTSSSAEESGHSRCSNPMFNDIYQLIDWSVRSNLSSILTDCPHREKLGWKSFTLCNIRCNIVSISTGFTGRYWMI